MNKKILVLGKGFVGRRLQAEFGCQVSASRIGCYHDAEKLIKQYRPQIIINCIGATGAHSVDDCELEKDNVLLANSFIPLILAEVALRNRIKLVQISSGCIFNYDYKKNKPINEDSQDYFLKLFYSRSKIYAERALNVLLQDCNLLIVRIRIPLLDKSHPKNLLDKLIKYKQVIDIPNSVTYIPDFVRALKHLINIDARGIYNVVNSGGLRYPALMRAYQKHVPEFKFRIIDWRKLGLTRTNLVLSTAKLQKTGFKVRNINSVLEECVKNYLKS